jgi:hypothetical protein
MRQKEQANESHREKVRKARKIAKKFKEPKKKRKVFISALNAEIRTNKSVKKTLKFYQNLYPYLDIID